MRHVVLHYHIFKNAGSTLHAALQRAFGTHACGRLEGAQPLRTLTAQALLDHVLANPQLRALSSHQARLPVPTSDQVTFHPLLLLRHPLDRVGSVYAFERRQPHDSVSIGAPVARESDLAGYVRWRLLPDNGSVIRNFQTVHLSANFQDMRTAVATQRDLAVALQHLQQLPCIGVVERAAQSLQLMQTRLLPSFGALDLVPDAHNVSPDRDASLDARLVAIERALGPQLHARLIEHNQLDLELYAAATRKFERDVTAMTSSRGSP